MLSALTLALFTSIAPEPPSVADDPVPTREFEIIDDRAHLGGEPVELWGLRCGNALHSATVTERHVRALDNMVAHGINLIGVYIQGSNGGYPDFDAGVNGFDRLGNLKGSAKKRLEWLVREADARGMVVMVGLFSPRKDQDFEDEAAVKNAVEQAGRFLVERKLRNVFVDIMHEYDHGRIDMDLFREPDGEAKKAKLHAWWEAVAPNIEAGVCPYVKTGTADHYPGMDVRIIQKHAAIPETGFVVNVETQKQDTYENDGVFTPEAKEYIFADCDRYLAEPRAALMLHAGYIQGIGNYSGTAPHPEMGGNGSGVSDRGIAFYYAWVRDHVGSWEYPRHISVPDFNAVPPEATRQFDVRDGLPHLDGEAVRLWGLRGHNALLSPAVTERLINNLDNMAAHGINLIGVSMQGTNSGFPDKELGPNAYAPNGHLLPKVAVRLERIVREANARDMVVCITLFTPRQDQLIRDEQGIHRAIVETGRFLHERKLGNVFVNLFQEFDHPLRADHELFREPRGEHKRSQLTAWFHGAAPTVEAGICPNHTSGTSSTYPGSQITFFHERMPIPEEGFAVNIETADRDLSGNAGNFNSFALASLHREWTSYLDRPHAAMLFRTPFTESVRGVLGTGPNFAEGGGGTGTSDRGIRPYYDWLAEHVGRWEYPRHVKD